MGSTKKKKEKDRERDRDEVSKSSRKRKHKSKSRSPPSSPTHSAAKVSKKAHKKHKEKRKHSESEDSDVPLTKSTRIAVKNRSASPGEIVDDVSPPRVRRSPSPPPRGRRSPSPPPRGRRSPSPPPRGRRTPSPPPRGRRSPSPPTRGRRSPSPPSRNSGGGGDASLSIEETNKLRIKLGLKPLQVDSAPPPKAPPSKKPAAEEAEEGEEEFDEETLRKIREERETEADTFWKEKQDFVHAPAENITEIKQAEKIREKIKAVREKRRLEERLAGVKSLADESDEELDDAKKWVERQKRAAEEKSLAEKRAKALSELDDEFGVGDLIEQDYQRKKSRAYTDKDLKGLKVLHSEERIQEGETVVLTLKDKGVLDEEDDTLVNVNMIDDEKFEKNIEGRKLRPEFRGYNAFDEIDFDSEGNLKQKGVLAKYDEEIDKSSGIKSFTIGTDVSEETRKRKIREKMTRADKILESLEGTNLKLASDFYSPDEMVAFKKSKKKVRKVRKVLHADDLLKLSADAPTPQASSSRKRDLGSRNRKGSEEDESLAIKTEPVDMDVDLDVDDLPPAPEIDDFWTVKVDDEADADFQLALTKARKLQQKKESKLSAERIAEKIKQETADEDGGPSSSGGGNIVLYATSEFCRTLGDLPSQDGADIYGDEEMDFEQEEQATTSKQEERGRWAEVEIDETPVDITREPDIEDAPILEQEPDVGTGLAGALKLAMKKGYLDQEIQKRGVIVTKMKHLEAQNYSIEDKNYEDERIHKRDMYGGPVSEFKEKEGYRPDVKLDYVDEDGKTISSKEAFRLLSHKFHGKGSGKNKIDKKRRKQEQMKLMQQMNSTDTPLGTLELLQQKQKEAQSPYIVLTGKAQHAALAKSKR